MKRLGKFTGTVYGDGYDLSQIKECCLLISDEQSTNEEFIYMKKLKHLSDCANCFGCPASQGKQ